MLRETSDTGAWRVTDQKPVRSPPLGGVQLRVGRARISAKAACGMPWEKVAGS